MQLLEADSHLQQNSFEKTNRKVPSQIFVILVTYTRSCASRLGELAKFLLNIRLTRRRNHRQLTSNGPNGRVRLLRRLVWDSWRNALTLEHWFLILKFAVYLPGGLVFLRLDSTSFLLLFFFFTFLYLHFLRSTMRWSQMVGLCVPFPARGGCFGVGRSETFQTLSLS